MLQGYHSVVALDASEKTGQEASNYGSVLTHCLDVLNVQQRLSGNAGHSLETLHSRKEENKTEATTQLLLVTPL